MTGDGGGQGWDVIVIGGGPGGYVAAIRAAQLGLRTLCVDDRARLGGTCLNEGCIPSKSLLASSQRYQEAREGLAGHGVVVSGVALDLAVMMARKEQVVDDLSRGIATLFRKYRVTHLRGRGRLSAPDTVAVLEHGGGESHHRAARGVVLACGSRSASLPGLEPDGERIITSREALTLDAVPGRLAVIGGGPIGLELGSLWRRLGAEVTILEAMPEILPALDVTVHRHLKRLFKKQGLTIRTATRVVAVTGEVGDLTLTIEDARGGREQLAADRVLLAAGRQPVRDGAGELALGVELTDRGRIRVDGDYRTAVAGVYAIGDLIDGPMLAHKAMEEGAAVAEKLAGHPATVAYGAIPAVVYTHPEIAWVGLSEGEAKARGLAVKVGQFPFLACGRAKAAGDADGVVKVVAAEDGRLLGVHMLGPHVSELVATATTALAAGWSGAEFARRVVVGHPTLTEALKEAFLSVEGAAVHI